MRLAKTNMKPSDFYGGYKKTKLLELIEEFLESNEPVMEIVDHEYSSISSGCNSIRAHILRFGEPVRVCRKDGKIYLVKM